MAFMASGNARGYAARGYNLRPLARVLDVAALMTYDQHGPWSGPGPIAAMPWVRAELRYFLTRVPRRKVDLGAAAYGYQWGGGAPQLTVPQARALAGSRAVWSPTRRVARHPRRTGGRIWWDDARSVELRRRVAVAQGLHGLAIWEIGVVRQAAAMSATPRVRHPLFARLYSRVLVPSIRPAGRGGPAPAAAGRAAAARSSRWVRATGPTSRTTPTR